MAEYKGFGVSRFQPRFDDFTGTVFSDVREACDKAEQASALFRHEFLVYVIDNDGSRGLVLHASYSVHDEPPRMDCSICPRLSKPGRCTESDCWREFERRLAEKMPRGK